MTTPALTPTEVQQPAAAPTDADMIEALYRAFSSLVPGAAQGRPEQRHDDTIARLRHYGADEADLHVISTWLAGRQE